MLINTIFLEDSFLIKRQSRGIADFPSISKKNFTRVIQKRGSLAFCLPCRSRMHTGRDFRGLMPAALLYSPGFL